MWSSYIDWDSSLHLTGSEKIVSLLLKSMLSLLVCVSLLRGLAIPSDFSQLWKALNPLLLLSRIYIYITPTGFCQEWGYNITFIILFIVTIYSLFYL